MKEGFLLYYDASESKAFERAHHFNIHPKVSGQPRELASKESE